MLSQRINIPWGTIGKIIIALFGIVPAMVLLVNFINSRSPQITVTNELAFPIRIYASGEYQGIVSSSSKRRFKFYSEQVFPVQISWQGVQQKDQNGGPIGEIVTGAIELVDNHQVVVISNTTGENDYFMPILSNGTDMACKVYINDGLPSEKYGGLLLPHKQRVNTGYYKWFVNSNVTLYCDDGPHWWGIRNGNSGPNLKVKGPNGQTELDLTP